MKNIPVVAKVVINVIFFLVYSFIGIILGDFLYGLIQVSLNKPVAGSFDPIHTKIALISVLIILLVSGLLRKYFYFPVFVKQEEKQTEKKQKTYTQKIKQKQENIETQKEAKMKIYIDKEIK